MFDSQNAAENTEREISPLPELGSPKNRAIKKIEK
jgi:hypothetical protein